MSESEGRRYYASGSGQEREIVVHDDWISVDGDRAEVEMSTLPGSDRQHLRLDGRSVSLFARQNGTTWIVELEGRSFEIRVEDERTRHIRELAAHVTPVETSRELRAPMPGLIVRVDVELGSEVEEGDALVVMEAMKMENELRADGAGTVTSIAVEQGQAVERDAVLLTIERR